MGKNETIHIRVNENVKAYAEETLSMLGISISEAVNMFLCQVKLYGGIPFDVKLPSPEHVIAHSREKLYQKLEEGENDISLGKTNSADEVFSRLNGKYDIQP